MNQVDVAIQATVESFQAFDAIEDFADRMKRAFDIDIDYVQMNTIYQIIMLSGDNMIGQFDVDRHIVLDKEAFYDYASKKVAQEVKNSITGAAVL